MTPDRLDLHFHRRLTRVLYPRCPLKRVKPKQSSKGAKLKVLQSGARALHIWHLS